MATTRALSHRPRRSQSIFRRRKSFAEQLGKLLQSQDDNLFCAFRRVSKQASKHSLESQIIHERVKNVLTILRHFSVILLSLVSEANHPIRTSRWFTRTTNPHKVFPQVGGPSSSTDDLVDSTRRRMNHVAGALSTQAVMLASFY
jgi:hypothetical protein